MKHLITTLLLAALSLQLPAQDLRYEDLSRPGDIYRTAGEWAEVMVQTGRTVPLRFVSNVDGKITHDDRLMADDEVPKRMSALIYRIDREGNDLVYHIVFRTGRRYAGRILTAVSGSFNELHIDLGELTKKSLLHFRVYNPEDTEGGTCFQEHYVKGNRYFANFKYAAAKEEYLLAAQCYEATEGQRDEAAGAKSRCDTIMTLMERGNQAAGEGRYVEGADIFMRAYMLSPHDTYLVNRYNYCFRNQNSLCAIYQAEAESRFREKDYETAKALYREMVDNGCDRQAEAAKRMTECDLLIRKRTNTERYFGVEMANGRMMGFTIAGYSNHVGVFASFRANAPLLRLARNEFNIEEIAKLDAVLGITIPLLSSMAMRRLGTSLFHGVWLNVGVGVTASNRFEVNETLLNSEKWGYRFKGNLTQSQIEKFIEDYKNDPDERGNAYSDPTDVMSANYGVSTVGELGLTVKLWRVALKGSYYFRHPVSKVRDYKSLLGENAFSIGLGYCW